jgi:hypothetical protein
VSGESIAVVVGRDLLAQAMTDHLRGRRVEVLAVCGHQLGDLTWSLESGSLKVERRQVRALLLREPPSAIAGLGYAPEDHGFVAAELGATVLAATHLPSVLAINRLDAEGWFEDALWPVWHRVLKKASVKVSRLHVGGLGSGAVWRPYTGGPDRPPPSEAVRRTLGTALAGVPVQGSVLFACGDAVGGEPPRAVREAASVLERCGIRLMDISFDAAGSVATVDAFPEIAEDMLDPVVARLAVAFDDHLCPR